MTKIVIVKFWFEMSASLENEVSGGRNLQPKMNRMKYMYN